MMLVWSINLYEITKGFKVVIKSPGRTVEGRGRTPQEAHRAAECKLVVKPWICAESPEQRKGD